jgi:hypothetical protein
VRACLSAPQPTRWGTERRACSHAPVRLIGLGGESKTRHTDYGCNTRTGHGAEPRTHQIQRAASGGASERRRGDTNLTTYYDTEYVRDHTYKIYSLPFGFISSIDALCECVCWGRGKDKSERRHFAMRIIIKRDLHDLCAAVDGHYLRGAMRPYVPLFHVRVLQHHTA